jgi:hypothetical protein
LSDDDATRLECYGGPWDGRHILDRGSHFTVRSRTPEEGPLQLQARRLGIFKRRRDGYHWWPTKD